MTELETKSSDSESENCEEEYQLDLDSDEELQEAFAAGLIKPGLNTLLETKPKKKQVNQVEVMKLKLSDLEVKLPWIERLDLTSKKAPLAPELAFKEEQHSKERQKILKDSKAKITLSQDPVHNDFLREMGFYRQAQSAVLEAIPRLKAMNIKTKRPEDYFAQMAKSDQHMQKIREKLVSKQATEERIEKIRKLRELRKFGKKVQVEVQQKKHKEKREMLEQVKKFRKGQTDTIDFLEDDDSKKKKKNSDARKKVKDKKFGFGGKKKGSKLNNKDSVNDVSGFRPGKKKKSGNQPKHLGAKLKGKRMGKNRRQNVKNRKK